MTKLRTLARLGSGAAVCATAAGVLAAIRLRDNRRLARVWRSLEEVSGRDGVFTEAMVTHLPDPARRYFLHCIQPGTPLDSRLHWRYIGSMKPTKQLPWMSLRAEQISAEGRGFVWRARARKGPLILTVTDLCLDGVAQTQVRLFDLVPMVRAKGPDLSRSAAGRMAIERVVSPATLLPGPHCEIQGLGDDHFVARIRVGGDSTPVVLHVDSEGRLVEGAIERWGNITDDGTYRPLPYGCKVLREGHFDGYTVPTQFSIGWWYGTDRYLEVVRVDGLQARFG